MNTSIAITKPPRFYRDLLRRVTQCETTAFGGLEAKSLLLGHGFRDLDELREAAAAEEAAAKPPKLTKAEKALALARNAVEQAEAETQAEREKFIAIEALRMALCKLEAARAKLSPLSAMKADREAALEALALETVENFTAISPDGASVQRFDSLVWRVSSLDAQIATHRRVCEELDRRSAAVESELAALEANAEAQAVAAAH